MDAKITTWVNDFSDDLYRWALAKVNDVETAQDLVQETFFSAVKSFDSYKSTAAPKTWLFSILKNKIADHFRKVYKEREAPTEDVLNVFFDQNDAWGSSFSPASWSSAEPHLLDNPDFNVALQNCLGKLPDKWQSAIQYKYLEEKKGEQICKELEITPTNFWQMLHRAKLQLRSCLESSWFSEA